MTYSNGSRDRRGFFRVKAAPDDPIRVFFQLLGDSSQVFLARVESISVGGVGIVLSLLDKPDMAPGVGAGFLILPTFGRVHFEGMVEWTKQGRIGVRFIKISESDRSLIFRYIIKRERETVQKVK